MTPLDLTPYLHNAFLRTTDLHDAFAGKRVFIAGATGFYGRWFLAYFRYLREQGIDVAVQGGSRATGWDILDDTTYTPFQREAHYVINAAGSSCAATPEELSAHLEGAERLAEAAMGLDCERLLHISTGAVTGAHLGPYAIAKAHAEATLTGMCAGRIQIVRPFATVGPDMPLDTHFAIASFIRSARAGRPLMAKVGVVRSFAHITDLLVQMLYVMVHGDGKPYEVGSDDAITIECAANLISDQVIPTRRDDFATNAAAERYVADLTRVRSHFNLSLDWDSRAAVLDTWNHCRIAPISA